MTRKEFLYKSWWWIALPYVLFIFLMTNKHKRVNKPGLKTLSSQLPEGISFHDDVICVKSDGRLNVYSARCSHLGCIINKSEDGLLVCPCHGSTFDNAGKVAKGPALDDLRQLTYIKDPDNPDSILIEVL